MGEKPSENENSIVMIVKDILSSVLIVLAILFVVYLISGTWPVVVAVESGSMEPNIRQGDIIFLFGTNRMNITTHENGGDSDYKTFDEFGNVVIYRPNGNTEATPIIHRAMYIIDEGEKMPNGRPAPHTGYVTKGDNNKFPDQAGILDPVKPEWVIGIARFRIPYLGYVTLFMRQIVGL